MPTDMRNVDIEYMRDHLAIQQLYAAYTYAVDSGDGDRLADCFTPDGYMDISSFKIIRQMPDADAMLRQFSDERGQIRGANIRKATANGMQAHHITANVLIHWIKGDKAKGSAYFMVFTKDGGKIEHYGRYEDDLVRCPDGRWRFAARQDIAVYERNRALEK